MLHSHYRSLHQLVNAAKVRQRNASSVKRSLVLVLGIGIPNSAEPMKFHQTNKCKFRFNDGRLLNLGKVRFSLLPKQWYYGRMVFEAGSYRIRESLVVCIAGLLFFLALGPRLVRKGEGNGRCKAEGGKEWG